MNLILLEESDLLTPQVARLRGSRFCHVRDILRAKPGDTIKVGLLNGARGSAVISDFGEDCLDLQLACDKPAPAKLPLTLILALPRPKAARRLCRTVAELGVQKLILLNSYRVEKSYWQSPLLTPDKIRSYFIEGLQQAGDTVVPELEFEKRFKPFVEDRLPELLHNKRGLVAHPYGQGTATPQTGGPSILAIGPEGGFIPYEVEKLNTAGMHTYSLGERILSVETAVPTLISQLFQ